MNRFAKAFHLACAIIASCTCVLWFVVFGLLVLYWRPVSLRLEPATLAFLVLPALLVGAGAVMEFRFYKNEREGITAHSDGPPLASGGATTSTGLVLVTTKPRALAAIALTLWILVQGTRSLLSVRPYSLISLYSGLLPHWAVVIATAGLYGAFLWVAVSLAWGSLRKEEKALVILLLAGVLLAPIGVLLPKVTLVLRVLQTLLELSGLLASISILLCLHEVTDERREEEIPGSIDSQLRS